MIKSKYFRADKIEYKDGVGCCIWYPFEDDEDVGICMDINAEHIDDLIALLQVLKDIPAEKFDYSDEI